jgi:hypothetical protein
MVLHMIHLLVDNTPLVGSYVYQSFSLNSFMDYVPLVGSYVYKC